MFEAKYNTNTESVKREKIISLSYFEKCVVRRTFLDYYGLNKDILTFRKN
jgi:hypothetical protein